MTALDLMISKEYQMKDRSKSLITYKKQKTTEISSSPIINFGETYKLQREVRNKEYRLIQESRKEERELKKKLEEERQIKLNILHNAYKEKIRIMEEQKGVEEQKSVEKRDKEIEPDYRTVPLAEINLTTTESALYPGRENNTNKRERIKRLKKRENKIKKKYLKLVKMEEDLIKKINYFERRIGIERENRSNLIHSDIISKTREEFEENMRENMENFNNRLAQTRYFYECIKQGQKIRKEFEERIEKRGKEKDGGEKGEEIKKREKEVEDDELLLEKIESILREINDRFNIMDEQLTNEENDTKDKLVDLDKKIVLNEDFNTADEEDDVEEEKVKEKREERRKEEIRKKEKEKRRRKKEEEEGSIKWIEKRESEINEKYLKLIEMEEDLMKKLDILKKKLVKEREIRSKINQRNSKTDEELNQLESQDDVIINKRLKLIDHLFNRIEQGSDGIDEFEERRKEREKEKDEGIEKRKKEVSEDEELFERIKSIFMYVKSEYERMNTQLEEEDIERAEKIAKSGEKYDWEIFDTVEEDEDENEKISELIKSGDYDSIKSYLGWKDSDLVFNE